MSEGVAYIRLQQNNEIIQNHNDRLNNLKSVIDSLPQAGGVGTSDATATVEDIFDGKFAYINGGKCVGTLSTNVADNFYDTNAKCFIKIWQEYHKKEIRVLTNSDKSLNAQIYFVPTKLDGTPLIDTSAVTKFGNFFKDFKNLICVPSLDTSNGTGMAGFCEGCISLIAVALFDTSKMTNATKAFKGCCYLQIIPLFNLSNCQTLDYFLYECSSLLEVPQFDTSSAIGMEYMCGNCKLLTTIPVLNTSNCLNMTGFCSNCENLSRKSLGNILTMCINCPSNYKGEKTLTAIGMTENQKITCQELTNYQAFLDAGWTL